MCWNVNFSRLFPSSGKRCRRAVRLSIIFHHPLIVDDRLHIRLLSLSAFTTVAHCAQWILTNFMASQPSQDKSKEKAWWSCAKEVAFLDYLVKHRSEAAHGSFKPHTMSGAIAAIAPLYEKGAPKKVSVGMSKWSTVSFWSLINYTDDWQFV